MIEIDRDSYRVKYKGKPVHVPAREWDILTVLEGAGGKVLSREKILSAVPGRRKNATIRAVDQYVARLRRRLGDGVIRTVSTRGYSYEG